MYVNTAFVVDLTKTVYVHNQAKSLFNAGVADSLRQIVEAVLNKHERGVGYPGATIKIPFSATLDYYNRRDQLYTKPVTQLAEYLLQELKRVTRSRWFE
jgi:hypothetical protein